MTRSNDFATHAFQDDEIDLWQLISVLWKGKYWILLTIIACGALGALYVLTTQEEWVAEANATLPDYADYQPMDTYIHQLAPAFGSSFKTLPIVRQLGSENKIFERFIRLFTSQDNKIEFLSDHPIFLNSASKNFNNKKIERALTDWANNISATTDSRKKEETINYALSFRASTADDSYTLLNDYIQFTNQKVSEEIQKNLESVTVQQKYELDQSLDNLKKRAQSRIESEIARLSHAYNIASAANIKVPLVDPGVSDEFRINLGSNAIEAKITELKKLNNLSVIEPDIITTDNQLRALAAIDLSKQPVFTAYKLTKAPTEPLNRNHPKRALILLAFLFMGSILGCIIVFIKDAVNSKLKRDA